MNISRIAITVLISCTLLFGTLFFLPGFSTADNVDNTLTLGQEVTGHLSGTGAKDYYSVTLDNSYSSLTVKTYGTTGGYDFDLYVKAGQEPTINDYDACGYTTSADETVTLNAPRAGTYYIMVNSYSGSGGYNLIAQASNSASDVTQLQIGEQGSGRLTGTGDSTYFSVSIPDRVGTMKVVTNGPENADFDLYVRAGAYPTISTYDGRGYTDSSDEAVTINNPEPGTYYIMVNSYSGSGDFTILVSTTGGDSHAPIISNVASSGITSTSAVITWTTDEPSSSIVEYGTSSLTQQANGADGVTSHSVTLSGLLASTTYKFRVVSVDASGNRAEGSQGTFTTLDEASSITSIPLNGAGLNGYLSGTGQKAYYTVDVPSGYSHLTVSTYNTGSGYDFDLYIRAGAKPTTSTYDDRGYTESASETVNIDNPSGLYYVMVNSYSGSGSYSIKAVASAADTTAPQISDISVSSITSNSAIITWTTDESSTSSVEYGTTSSYGHSASGGSGTSHSVTLNGLSPATTYHYKVISADQSGNSAESNDRTFTTSQEDTNDNNNNGNAHTYKVLFDNAHSQTAGNADWTITGGFSDFADDLSSRGMVVDQWGNDEQGRHQRDDDPPITYDVLKQYDAYVIPEPNQVFTRAEQNAIIQYIAQGGSVFFISDHMNSDRNNDGWDSVEIFNGFQNGDHTVETEQTYDSDFVGRLGFRFREKTFSEDPITNIKSHPITQGVEKTGCWSGTSEYIMDTEHINGIVYFQQESRGPFVIAGTYGNGRFAAIGDSSPIDDGTGTAGHRLYDGYSYGDDRRLSVNIMEWLIFGEVTGDSRNVINDTVVLNNHHDISTTASHSIGRIFGSSVSDLYLSEVTADSSMKYILFLLPGLVLATGVIYFIMRKDKNMPSATPREPIIKWGNGWDNHTTTVRVNPGQLKK